MRIRVRYFAYYKERIGAEYETVEIPPESTVSDLISTLMGMHPGKFKDNDIFISVNYRFADKNERIKENELVGVMPHVSGG
ncbi:MAG: MoaD/ThiS family protein [Thermoplasmata archaeon]